MIIVFLNGGLANQSFQYILYRFLQLRRGSAEGIYLDDSFFFVERIHNGYELERVFGLKPALLSGLFDPDVWEEMIRLKREGKSIPQQFLELGEPIRMMAEVDHRHFNPFSGEVYVPEKDCSQFMPNLAELEGDWYLHFYGLNTEYFKSYKDILSKEFTFPAFTEPHNLEYEKRIRNEESISLHVRRGDYVALGKNLEPEYYKKSVQALLEEVPEAQLVVFSDDLPWCRANEEALGISLAKKILYIEGNANPNNYRDLQLMSLCPGMIVGNSSFCCLAAMLNRNLKYLVNFSGMELPV